VKLGTENKKKTIVAVGLMIVAIAVVVYQFTGHESTEPQTATPAGAAKPVKKTPVLMAHSLDPTLRFDLLKSSEDVTYKGTGRDIFRSEAPPPDIPKPNPAPMPMPQTPPPPPPIPLKFYGYEGGKGGANRIFLIKGEDIFLAKEGDIVDRRYKIVHVGPASVEVQDVLTNNTQTIPLTAG
jgi:hypothetical protein